MAHVEERAPVVIKIKFWKHIQYQQGNNMYVLLLYRLLFAFGLVVCANSQCQTPRNWGLEQDLDNLTVHIDNVTVCTSFLHIFTKQKIIKWHFCIIKSCSDSLLDY